MTDLLFALPADRSNELETARKRLAAAQEAYDDYAPVYEDGDNHAPQSVRDELNNARACLGLIERQEMERRK